MVLDMARNIPDDEQRDRPRAAFAHAVVADGSPWDQALALLGRDPRWRPPT